MSKKSTSKKKSASKKKSTSKKNRIFSGKDIHGKMKETKKSTPQEIIAKILDTDDIRKLSYEEKKTLKSYLKKRQKEINQKIEEEPNFVSSKMAVEEELANRNISSNPLSLFNELMAQNQFFSEYSSDIDVKENAKDYPDVEKVLKEDDKWTILRRLATQDVRLNYDRAYASETLKEIEDMIESGYYENVDSVTEMWLEKHFQEVYMNLNWNSAANILRQTEADKMLSFNKGFHGIDKAQAKWEKIHEKSSKQNYFSFKLDDFEPVW